MNELQELKEITLLSDDDLRRIWLHNELQHIDREKSPSWYRQGESGIWPAIVASLVACIPISLFLNWNPTGYIVLAAVALGTYTVYSCGWVAWKKLRLTAKRQAKAINLENPDALGTVVEALCQPAIRHANDIRRGIDYDMRQIKYAQEDLTKMTKELLSQLRSAKADYARDLLTARMSDAERAIKNLTLVLTQLTEQRQQVDQAIFPVEDLYGKFLAIWSVNHQVERIQVAYRLTTDTVDRIEVRRHEIDKLYHLTDEAEFRLRELASSVEAERKARLEVRELVGGAVQAPMEAHEN